MAVSPDQFKPQLSPRSTPTVNQIAGKTLAPAAPRFEARKIKVWPPNGGPPEIHDSFNARDLIRLHGWTDVDPAGPKDPAGEVQVDSDADDQVYDESSENAELLEAAAKKLQAHRDVLNRLGVKYNKNWGLRRLKEEIEAAGGIIPTE